MKTNSKKTNNRLGKTSSLLTKREHVSHVSQGCKETGVKTGRNYRKIRCLDKHKEKEHKHLYHRQPKLTSREKAND